MKLFLICGKAESGKDYFGNLLKEEYERDGRKVCILKITRPLYEYAKDYFGWDGDETTKPRELLQTLGIEVIREKLGKKRFLLDRLTSDIEILDSFFDVGIITDGRLIDEFDYLRETYPDLQIIRIHRNKDNKLTEEEKKHITEIDLDNPYQYDYELENTSVTALKKAAHDIFSWESKYEIAIDGPCAVGKSATAKRLAKKLGFIYIDTGAMYRAFALYYLRKKIFIEDEEEVNKHIDEIFIDIKYVDDAQRIYLNGEDVTDLIRTSEVSDGASKVSVFTKVREKLVALQRTLAFKNDVIMDGRDIGTVVLPNADLKIYLTCDLDERARRRQKDYLEKGDEKTLEEIKRELLERDNRDMNRANSPLKRADEAIDVDSTNYSVNEVVEIINKLFKERSDKHEIHDKHRN